MEPCVEKLNFLFTLIRETYLQLFTFYNLYSRAEKDNDNLPEILILKIGFVDLYAINWCKIFTDPTNKYCFENIYKEKCLHSQFHKINTNSTQDIMQFLLSEASMDEADYKVVKDKLKTYRNIYAAHRDKNAIQKIINLESNNPQFEKNLVIASTLGLKTSQTYTQQMILPDTIMASYIR